MRALRQREESQLALPGIATPTSLELRPGLSEGEWLEAGRTCALIERANRWWIGDFLKYEGASDFGETTIRNAEQLFELDYMTLGKFRWVASRIDILRRIKKLQWSHHEVVAALEPEAQDNWLRLASEHGWSVRELKARIKADRRELPTHKPLLRFCQDLATPIIVQQILRVYFPDAETALDLTGGDGGFWNGSELIEVTRLHVDPSRPAGETENFRSLPHIADGAHDVTLFDPPHLADSSTGSIMGDKFGTIPDDEIEQAIGDGCHEAWRIGRLGTIIKVTDHVHGSRYVLESDWVRAAIGQPPFDEVYQVRANAVIDPKWNEQLSAYNNGATYLIFRKDGPMHVRRAS